MRRHRHVPMTATREPPGRRTPDAGRLGRFAVDASGQRVAIGADLLALAPVGGLFAECGRVVGLVCFAACFGDGELPASSPAIGFAVTPSTWRRRVACSTTAK